MTRWARLILGSAWAVISYVGGLLVVASIFSKYGFRWHGDVAHLIEEYRNTVYPVFNRLTDIARNWLHLDIHIGDTAKDVLSLLGLAFSAANSESLVLDERELYRNISASVFAMLTKADRNRDSGTNMFRINPSFRKVFEQGLRFILKAGALVALFTNAAFFWWIWHLPLWLIFWMPCGLVVVGVTFYDKWAWNALPNALSHEDREEQLQKFANWLTPYITRLGADILFTILALVALPGLLVFAFLWAFAYLVTLVFYLIICASIFLLISPIVAWRSTLITAAIIGVAIILNSYALRGEAPKAYSIFRTP